MKEMTSGIKTPAKSGGKYEKEKKYWAEKLAGELTPSGFPPDNPRKNSENELTGTVTTARKIDFSDHLNQRLMHLGNKSPMGMFIILTTGITYLLSRYTGSETVVIGIPKWEKSAYGNQVNRYHILANRVNRDMTFKELLVQVKTTVMEAGENSRYITQQDILRLLNPAPWHRENRRLDTRVKLENIHRNGKQDSQESDTLFNFTIEAGRLKGEIQYDASLYLESTIDRLVRYLVNLLEGAVDHIDMPLAEIDIFSEEEKQQLLYRFNDTKMDLPESRTIHRCIEEQEKRTPDAAALAVRDEVLSYRELNRKARQVARYLRHIGITTNSFVGIKAERSAEMLVGLLGILYAGAAYLPIDPDFPRDRIDYMLNDSAAQVLVTAGSVAKNENVRNVSLNHAAREENAFSEVQNDASPLPETDCPTKPCYVIYTSGSTGKPKGVVIQHGAAINFLRGMERLIPHHNSDNVLTITTISFDIFGLEVYLPLMKGAKVVVGTREEQLNAAATARVIERECVTVMQATPSRWQLMVDIKRAAGSLGRLKNILVGGEAFPPALLEKLRQLTSGKIFNLYGPTETTVWSTVKDVSACNPLTIGKPIANTQIYIIDAAGAIQPVGIAGELLIAGDGLSTGYLNKPELTAEKFGRGFVRVNKSVKAYKTGDLARWLPDGEIQYLGRSDCQVKVQGHRIELEEIEKRLVKHPAVKEVAVVIIKMGKKTAICAYYLHQQPDVAADDELEESNMRQQLRQFLSKNLPDYMLPSYFIRLERFPLTPNGKIDRKALPEPTRENSTAAAFEKPRNPVEQKLADIWTEMLKIEQVGIHDDFFDLGGQSVDMLKLVARIFEDFNVEIPLTNIYKGTSIKNIAEKILETEEMLEPPAVYFNNDASKGIINCFPPAQGYGIQYRNLASCLTDYKFQAFNFIEDIGDDERIQVYKNKIIENKPGPNGYILMGWSAAGGLTLQVAHRMEKEGKKIAAIILIDCNWDRELKKTAEYKTGEQFVISDHVKQFLESLGSESLKKNVEKKMRAYLYYNNRLRHLETVAADIHFISSVERIDIFRTAAWETFTTGRFNTSNGYGCHNLMLEAQHVADNARIIQRVVDNVLTR